MNCQSESPVHLSSHIRHFASVGATICHLETKEGHCEEGGFAFEHRQRKDTASVDCAQWCMCSNSR